MQSGAAQKVQRIMQCFSRHVDDVMQTMLFFIEELMASQARSHLHTNKIARNAHFACTAASFTQFFHCIVCMHVVGLNNLIGIFRRGRGMGAAGGPWPTPHPPPLPPYNFSPTH